MAWVLSVVCRPCYLVMLLGFPCFLKLQCFELTGPPYYSTTRCTLCVSIVWVIITTSRTSFKSNIRPCPLSLCLLFWFGPIQMTELSTTDLLLLMLCVAAAVLFKDQRGGTLADTRVNVVLCDYQDPDHLTTVISANRNTIRFVYIFLVLTL